MRAPARETLIIYQGADYMLRLAILATDQGTGVESLVDTADYEARLTIRQDDADGAVMVAASDGNGQIVLGFTPPEWEADTSYEVGEQVVPPGFNGFIYECVQAGQNATEPDWPTTIGDVTTSIDPIALWRCAATDATVVNLDLHLTAAQTAALEDWGKGLYTLELEDASGHVTRLLEGPAYLSREATY